MPWTRSPVKLFGFGALLLFVVRLVFPPADFAGALHAHSYVRLFDFRLDLTGYGLIEFPAFIFLFCAIVYYLTARLTGRMPPTTLVHLHFWPNALFAAFSIFLAHWVNRTPSSELSDPAIRASLSNLAVAYSYALITCIVVQVIFVISALGSIWRNRHAVAAA